jgi:hypothetical protein
MTKRGSLNDLALLRVGAKNQKEPTRASIDGRQSLFRKRNRREKNIPHPHVLRIQSAVPDFDPQPFCRQAGRPAKQNSNFHQLSRLTPRPLDAAFWHGVATR